MRRRDLAAMGGAAALAAAIGVQSDDVQVSEAVWVNVPCPGCRLPVAFLPDQKVNRCAHCKTAVARGLV